MDPGQGFEPRPPGSEPGVLPVRRSRSVCGRAPQEPSRLRAPLDPSSLQGFAVELRVFRPGRKTAPRARRRLSVHTTLGGVDAKSCLLCLAPARAETMFSKPLALLFDPGSSRSVLREPSCRPSWRSFGARCVRGRRKKALVNQGAISASPFLRESARDLLSLGRGLDSN
jgi:hypothetical protein